MLDKVYLDYAATTPVDPEVIRTMEPYLFEKFANPSSPHSFGREAKKAMEDARVVLARFIGASPEEILFTSGATESNNHAILGLTRFNRDKGKQIIVSKIEHHSVLEPVELLEQEGFQVTYLSVDQYGRVDPEEVKGKITGQTILIAVLHASNEIGAIQPVEAIGRIARERGIPFLVDAVQSVGHIPVNVNDLCCDLLSLSAHKMYGPKGLGALYVKKGIKLRNFLLGGDQERGRRASTQNVSGAVGLAKAVELCVEKMNEEKKLQTAMRDQLISGISNEIVGSQLNGHPSLRLPNNCNFSFESIVGESLMMSLDLAGFACSQGSACTSGAMKPSHVLKALGRSDELAYGALRITIGRWTTPNQVERFICALTEAIGRLREAGV